MDALKFAINARRQGQFVDPFKAHETIASIYNWRDVSRRTEIVYDAVESQPSFTDSERMAVYLRIGWLVGPLYCLVLGLARIIMWLCDYFLPRDVSWFPF